MIRLMRQTFTNDEGKNVTMNSSLIFESKNSLEQYRQKLKMIYKSVTFVFMEEDGTV